MRDLLVFMHQHFAVQTVLYYAALARSVKTPSLLSLQNGYPPDDVDNPASLGSFALNPE